MSEKPPYVELEQLVRELEKAESERKRAEIAMPALFAARIENAARYPIGKKALKKMVKPL